MVWSNMKAMNVNTLLGAVTWEMIEPVEGQFCFDKLDNLIREARQYRKKLVLLWFGSFKNGLSSYVPAWVKQDVKRFTRAHFRDSTGANARTLNLLSPFCHNSWEADAKAFAALMKHLKSYDEAHSTVIMVQVENETGLLGDSRDRSHLADEEFQKPVPLDLVQFLAQSDRSLHPTFMKRFPDIKTKAVMNSTWQEVFGDGVEANETFMAHAFSKYVEHVAAAGKMEYNIPMYSNVWLNFNDPAVLDTAGVNLPAEAETVAGGSANPGVYPSGGACPHVLDIWQHNAPSIDFIAPDLYLHNYTYICQQYRHNNNILFVPEQRRDSKGVRRMMLAYTEYAAIGCSPFGIDTLSASSSDMTKVYKLLGSISKHILKAQATRPEHMMGFFFDELDHLTAQIQALTHWIKNFDEWEINIERSFVFGKPGPGNGIVIYQGNAKFLLIGWGFQVSFRNTTPGTTFTGILSAEKKTVDADGNLSTLRMLNGDELRGSEVVMMPNDNPDYGGFPIAVLIPARTYLAEFTAYSVKEQAEDY
ncbi:uncharacterized protein N7483_011536 [Penicillium malachiteum]|uniref:uncharacterized protein n=1 Tax=Penicillium malachiteum TaxID=1324776 RepID=UPI0025493984|nr:uncharacterized protein N7483_011536 [Penicillium malachiteum]KAJ5714355.1 hypothetical protein N7483_011536 [Penicillium malachiteum]